ncbi:hypothetical protein H0H81_005168 [Sphagnurus paluster]|uniref:LysM domain-containing protein n=1 Tax=Sphagnurus paluster TaxID=117069 RepID=A0A9P7K5M9_9AGAR|nr:hypothetical protein H0H81_005168 [Sphagnurus paluster]
MLLAHRLILQVDPPTLLILNSLRLQVVSGDTCTLIPQKALISSYQLTKLNPTLNCATLSVGQSLCVKDSTYDCQPVYKVKGGDSCAAIATSNKITTDQLIANNPNIGSNCIIQPDQMLCVAGATPTSATLI